MPLRHPLKTLVLISVAVISSAALPVLARTHGSSCSIVYRLSGWSFIYKQYDGSGYIRCSNGQRARVRLESKGGGLTAGVSEIEGSGRFTEVKDIREIYGTYASVEGHAGVTKSAQGIVLTKGIISLALSGTGRGIDLGVALGGLTITPLGRYRQ